MEDGNLLRALLEVSGRERLRFCLDSCCCLTLVFAFSFTLLVIYDDRLQQQQQVG
jgi:hypothetical protein